MLTTQYSNRNVNIQLAWNGIWSELYRHSTLKLLGLRWKVEISAKWRFSTPSAIKENLDYSNPNISPALLNWFRPWRLSVCNEITVIKSHTLPYQDLNSSQMYFKYHKTSNMLQRQDTDLEGISVLAKRMVINFQRKAGITNTTF